METEALRRALATAKHEKLMLVAAKHDELMRRGHLSDTRGAYAEARAHFQAAYAVEARAESFLAAADMAVKMGQPAAAVTEYYTLCYWVEDGLVPPLPADVQKALERKRDATRKLSNNEYSI